MKKLFTILCILFCNTIAMAQMPVAASGDIVRIQNFPSTYCTARNVDVWLPDGYSAEKKYAVLYMHDGQMLFDSAITWNKTAWDVDDVITKLNQQHKIKDVIVVGIWNSDKTRHPDYFPQKPYESLSQVQKDSITARLQRVGRTKDIFKPVSDNYLKFMVEELKPFIDKNYAVLGNRENTFIAGSSMGGLISLYAICEYPQIFGGAACLSTHWPGTFEAEDNPVPGAFIKYLQQNLPNPNSHKIYFDYGDQTLDAMYPALQKKVDAVMKAKGYTEKNWETKFFPGEEHSEKAWNKRLEIPLLFLLKQ